MAGSHDLHKRESAPTAALIVLSTSSVFLETGNVPVQVFMSTGNKFIRSLVP